MTDSLLPKLLSGNGVKFFLRVALFAYAGLILCPIQYFAVANGNVDETWVFALNYAAAHHLIMGRDIVWTSGPLAYLAAPMNIGNNLARGLSFQAALWVLLLAVLWDVYFRGRFSLRKLVFFSICLVLSTFVYHRAVNPLGAGDLLFVEALILLVHFRLRGGFLRYLCALVMLGLLPLINFVGVMLAAAAVAGLIIDFLLRGRSFLRHAVLAAVLPALVAGAGYWLLLGSFHSLVLYFKGSLELSRGYNIAMSLPGRHVELLAGLEVLLVLVAGLTLVAIHDFAVARFFILLLTIPVFLNFKHAFVRQDVHIVYVFCFTAVAMGLLTLAMALDSNHVTKVWAVLVLLLAVLCQDYTNQTGNMGDLTGLNVASVLWHALRFQHLRRTLDVEMEQNLSSGPLKLQPEIKAIVQHEPVASLSMEYSFLFADGLNLRLYPVLQRYSAYTPYLDNLNANWIRDHGPPFLLYDGKPLLHNGRQLWAETPAMWMEVYRWYDTRLLTPQNLLLERRSQPRFGSLDPLDHFRLRLGEELMIPHSPQPVFWSMKCSLTRSGRLRELLFRLSDIGMTVQEAGHPPGNFRVVPELLESPSLGNYLPSDLPEFAQVLSASGCCQFSVEKISVGAAGASAYKPACEVRLWRTTP
jgi:hypothetical protein